MKKKLVEKKLKSLGWYKVREGGRHEKWENGLGEVNFLARHPDIPEQTAKAILKKASANPGKSKEEKK